MEAISLILSGYTAAAFWSCFLADSHGPYLSPREASSAIASADRTLRTSDIRSLQKNYPVLANLPEQIDVLVPNQNSHRATSAGKFRVWSREISKGMLVDTGLEPMETGGKRFRILTESPEMLFVSAAASMSIAELVEFGYELCGRYAVAKLAKHGFIKLAARTSPKRIEAFMNEANAIPGAKMARKALPWVIAGSYSPKESQVSMLTSMPRRYGGFAHNAPTLNKTIVPPEPFRGVLGSKYCIPDMLWGNCILEYDSYEFHEKEQAERDARKRNLYRLLGYNVITLTYGQLSDLATFTTIIDSLGPAVVRKQHRPTADQLKKRQELHQWLLYGKRRYGYANPLLAGVDMDGGLPERIGPDT